MKRRTFTKTSLVTVAGTAIVPTSCSEPGITRTNWAGNLTYGTTKGSTPKDLAELTAVVQKKKRMKVLGTCHSFNEIADSRHYHVSLQGWQNEPVLDTESMTVTVDANIRYGELAIWLHERGYAIHNLASLPHISIAGACATATHGSGDGNGNLATAVVGFDMMKSDGSMIELDKRKDADNFNAALVGLGALGVITEMTLAVEPTFDVRQDLFQDLPLESMQKNFDAITSAG
ncbi:MAG: FAD-binding protein, partial [Saprospiraceae bacterium]|nr:FAD-binding protein [Saprospiraceae bacterium]